VITVRDRIDAAIRRAARSRRDLERLTAWRPRDRDLARGGCAGGSHAATPAAELDGAARAGGDVAAPSRTRRCGRRSSSSEPRRGRNGPAPLEALAAARPARCGASRWRSIVRASCGGSGHAPEAVQAAARRNLSRAAEFAPLLYWLVPGRSRGRTPAVGEDRPPTWVGQPAQDEVVRVVNLGLNSRRREPPPLRAGRAIRRGKHSRRYSARRAPEARRPRARSSPGGGGPGRHCATPRRTAA